MNLLTCPDCRQPTIECSSTFEGQRTSWYECPEHGRVGR